MMKIAHNSSNLPTCSDGSSRSAIGAADAKVGLTQYDSSISVTVHRFIMPRASSLGVRFKLHAERLGMEITDVLPASLANRHGVLPGDFIALDHLLPDGDDVTCGLNEVLKEFQSAGTTGDFAFVVLREQDQSATNILHRFVASSSD